MIQKLKLAFLTLTSTLLFAAPLAISGVASADNISQGTINNGLCAGSNGDFTNTNDSTCEDNINAGDKANSLVSTIINILSLVVGAVAVIMLIIGGFRYVTSGGKQESVTSAKNTIIYAIVGLVVVALAQLIVHFVLTNVSPSTG